LFFCSEPETGEAIPGDFHQHVSGVYQRFAVVGNDDDDKERRVYEPVMSTDM
jgi:hypothetical protein